MGQADTIDEQLRAARALEAEDRASEATDLLRRAAVSGDISAVAALGKHLLIHRREHAREGLKALDMAAQAGHAESTYLLALFIAEGVGFPQSWQTALGAVQHAAALGWQPAQRDIAFLTSEFKGTGPQTLDLSQWLQAPPAQPISPAPRIFAVKNFATPRICDRLIELGRPRLKSAQTYDQDTGALLKDGARTIPSSFCPTAILSWRWCERGSLRSFECLCRSSKRRPCFTTSLARPSRRITTFWTTRSPAFQTRSHRTASVF